MGRYVFIFNVFAVSGVFHALSDVSQGIPLSESGAMSFFCMQALGIMMEDGVQSLVRHLMKWEDQRDPASPPVFLRILGYFWVFAWLTWASPIWIYPAMQRDKGTLIIPF